MKVRSDSEAAVDLILKLFHYIDKADGETNEDERFCNDFFENQMRNWKKFNVQPYYFKEAIANNDEWIFNCFFQDVKSCWEVIEDRINTFLIWSLFDYDYNNIDDNSFENIKHAFFATTNLASLNVNEFQDKDAFCEKIGKLYDKLDIYSEVSRFYTQRCVTVLPHVSAPLVHKLGRSEKVNKLRCLQGAGGHL